MNPTRRPGEMILEKLPSSTTHPSVSNALMAGRGLPL